MEPTGKLELTWANKELRLLSHGSDTYEWVEPSDYRIAEVRPLRKVETVGERGVGICSSRATQRTRWARY